MIYSQQLTSQVATYVTNLFFQNEAGAPFLVYHNLLHTQLVVERTKEIADFYHLSEVDAFIVGSAAWFHDCGHLFGPAMDHELRSTIIMTTYMEGAGIEENIIQSIQSCILATKLPANPLTLHEKIICDADLYHLGTKEFYITDKLVKREFELRNSFIPSNWDANTLSFLKTHRFHTNYCRQVLAEGRKINIELMQRIIDRKN